MQPRAKILPFFIPMEGCPHQCIYCDQQAVSGHTASPDLADINRQAMAFAGGIDGELAFYGGSFSCLPRFRQEQYLAAAAPALACGKIGGLRISTRPDCVEKEELLFLAQRGIRTIELGIQSFDDQVLQQASRGYTGREAAEACRLVQRHGFRLGIQLMTGLPGDDRSKALATMAETVSLAPELIRIYPTVVLAHTPLAVLWQQGAYRPQTVMEAAELAADLLAMAEARDLRVIRLGLNPSIETKQAVVDGPYHPAFGQIVKARLKLLQIKMLLQNVICEQALTLYYPRRELPLLAGQKNVQLLALYREYPALTLAAADLPAGELAASGDFGWLRLPYRVFVQSYAGQLLLTQTANRPGV